MLIWNSYWPQQVSLLFTPIWMYVDITYTGPMVAGQEVDELMGAATLQVV